MVNVTFAYSKKGGCRRLLTLCPRFAPQFLQFCYIFAVLQGASSCKSIFSSTDCHYSEVQTPPSQLRFSLPSIVITIMQATNLETHKGTKWIEIHQSQKTNHDLLNPFK